MKRCLRPATLLVPRTSRENFGGGTVSSPNRAIGIGHWLLVLSIALFSGCGWGVKENLPDEPLRVGVEPAFYQLDLEASSVEYRGDNEPSFLEAWEVRDALGDLLRARAHTVDQNRRAAPPARFRAVVDVKRNLWPRTWFVLCIDLQVAGCPTGTSEATVELQLEVGGKVYAGKGAGSAFGGLYYNKFSGVPKAIAEAMVSAVSELTYTGTPAGAGAGQGVPLPAANSVGESNSLFGGQ